MCVRDQQRQRVHRVTFDEVDKMVQELRGRRELSLREKSGEASRERRHSIW